MPPIVQEVLRSPGQPLNAETRAFMEPRFGHDFSKVRVHADAKAAESAKAVNALAYTIGHDIIFAAGTYSPISWYGRGLIAHELTHVVQQNAISPPSVPLKIASLGKNKDQIKLQRSLDHNAAANYAERYALTPNTRYRYDPDRDCTNFVSQAMYAGGWTTVGTVGNPQERQRNDVWWYSLIQGPSYTWNAARNFANFIRASGRGDITEESNLQRGDVIQMNDAGGSYPTHSMIVTGLNRSGNNIDLLISAHSISHLDHSLQEIKGRHSNATFFPWRIF